MTPAEKMLSEMFGQHVDRMTQLPSFSEEAQEELLTSAFSRYNAPVVLKSGSLCREKVGLGLYEGNRLYLYVRALDQKNPTDMTILDRALCNNAATNTLDCMVMCVEPNGGVKFMPHDMRALEPVE